MSQKMIIVSKIFGVNALLNRLTNFMHPLKKKTTGFLIFYGGVGRYQ